MMSKVAELINVSFCGKKNNRMIDTTIQAHKNHAFRNHNLLSWQ